MPRKKLVLRCLIILKCAGEARKILEMMNVHLDLDEKTKNMRMAQKQMIEIAKALTFHAKILILDEPTASLTQREVDALFDIVRKLKSEGVAVVYISHRLEEIFELRDSCHGDSRREDIFPAKRLRI